MTLLVEGLFSSRRAAARARKIALPILGFLTAAILLTSVVVVIIGSTGAFGDFAEVKAVLPRGGVALPPHSPVIWRGVTVGYFVGSKVGPGTRTTLTLHIDSQQASHVPANATAIVQPHDVFGTERVAILPPASGPPVGHLRDGAVLAPAPESAVALEDALSNAYGLITAVRPAKLDIALTALAQALSGRGQQLGQMIGDLDHYLATVGPQTQTLLHDMEQVATLSDELNRDAPDLLATLRDAVTLSGTVVSSQQVLARALVDGRTTADVLHTLFNADGDQIVTLVRLLNPALTTLADDRANLARVVPGLQTALTGLDAATSAGPFLNLQLTLSTRNDSPYTSADCPQYPGASGPNCGGGG